MTATLKTFILMAGLTALFMVVGGFIGGANGALFAFLMAAAMNAYAYWNSDKMVLRMYHARPVTAQTAPNLYATVERLARNAGLPMPRVYMIDEDQPNAFATGRNPQNAAVAATTGLMKRLTPDEVAGVMAHELAHIKNRDTLTMTITATMAGAISMLANFVYMFGGMNRNGNGRAHPIIMILVAILAPIAAMLVQTAISRTREYEADRIGAGISGNPAALASALHKIAGGTAALDNHVAEQNPATAHMFIMNPLHAYRVDRLFSTHPATDERIKRLMRMTIPPMSGDTHTPPDDPFRVNPDTFGTSFHDRAE